VKIFRNYIFLYIISAIVFPLDCFAKNKVDGDAVRAARKADYIFNESLYYFMEGGDDAFFDMARYAYMTNPSDAFLASLAGMKQVMENNTDSATVEHGIELADEYFGSSPDDVYMGMPYVTMLYNMGRTDKAIEHARAMYMREPENSDIMQNYIRILASTGKEENIKEALDISNRYEELYGFDINTFRRKVELYSLTGDSAAVMNETRRLLAHSPSSPLTLSIVGAMYANYNSTDSAAYYFRQAIESDPSFSYAYMLRNALYVSTGDTASYVTSTLEAINQVDLDEESKIGIVADFLEKSVTSDSCAQYAGTILGYMTDVYPHSLPLRDLSARYYGASGQYDKAIESAKFAIDLDAENVSYRSLLSGIYYLTGDYVECARAALAAYEAIPHEHSFLLTASGALTQAGDYTGAIDVLSRLEAVTDTTDVIALSDLWLAMADVYSAADSISLSVEAFDKALAYNPDNSLALNNYAYGLACRGENLDKALDMVGKALRLSPDNLNALDTYAWVLFKQKKYSEAKGVIDELLERDNDATWELYDHAGDIYFMAGFPDEAVEFWEKASELNPDDELLRRKVTHKTFFYK